MTTNLRSRDLEALRDLRSVFDSAHELAADLPNGIDDVTLEAAIAHAGLSPRQAEHAFAFETVCDEMFRQDLEVDRLRQIDMAGSVAAINEVLEAEAVRFANGDPVDLALIAREVLRRGMAENTRAVVARDSWHADIFTAVARGADHLEQYRRFDDVSRCRLFDLHAAVSKLFGLRPREPMTIQEFTDSVSASLYGINMLTRSGHAPENTFRPTGPNGEMQEWSAAATMFEGLVLASFEEDPWAEVSADLSVLKGTDR